MKNAHPGSTVTKEVRIREKQPEKAPQIQWEHPPKPRRAEELLKNLAVASALVLCTVALRSGALPGASSATDALLAAVSGDMILDDTLGRLSFVSALFPEATLVFGENRYETLSIPVSGGSVVHACSQTEPYTAWESQRSEVFSSCDGTVMGVYHGEDEELLVQVMGDNGLRCIYGCLAQVTVQEGDRVEAGDLLGTLAEGQPCAFEVQQDGISVDPALYLRSAT